MVFEPTTSCLRVRGAQQGVTETQATERTSNLISIHASVIYQILWNSTECIFIRKNSSDIWCKWSITLIFNTLLCSKGVGGTHAPSGSNFFQFHAVSGKKIGQLTGWRPHLECLHPRLRKPLTANQAHMSWQKLRVYPHQEKTKAIFAFVWSGYKSM